MEKHLWERYQSLGTFPGPFFLITFVNNKSASPMKRITIKDLSKYLLLSTSTISRALLNDKNIHEDTKKKVLDAAEKLGYKPNPSALNLKYGRTKNIGLLVSRDGDSFFFNGASWYTAYFISAWISRNDLAIGRKP
ncbi:LacI family DNA-binding transcriptional regulator [Sphingobacterium sp. SG20118]|uniref:LacI family DNA-binding transcriptional regulator n=1 Tax=Sphingobacterium sp. SG20118 TaxID=3367156 RepID=UPI0037DFC2F9